MCVGGDGSCVHEVMGVVYEMIESVCHVLGSVCMSVR